MTNDNVHKWEYMTCSFQLKPVVASSLKAMESSPRHFTPASILLPWTASGPSRFATLLLSLAPSSTWNHSTHLLLHHPQPAMRGMLRQHYRSQAVQYLFYLHLSDCCCCRSSSWAAVFCVLVLLAWCVCSVCVCVCVCVCACVHAFVCPRPVLGGVAACLFTFTWDTDACLSV